MRDEDLIALPVTALAAKLAQRELTASEVVEAFLRRIEVREHIIHAWTVVDADGARQRARELDAGNVVGALHGLPVGIKDIIDTAALATTYGSPIYAGHRPQQDAACVAAARKAGAIVLGKTVSTEFATFKPAATVNPRDVTRTPGGSSSGSAAAVADRMVPLALGTQTLGSVIRPASYCGIVGFKPSFGTLPVAGVKLIAPSLDTVGVFAQTVADAALCAGAIAGRPALQEFPQIPPSLRIGLCRTHEWPAVQSEGHAAMDGAARALADRGAAVETIELPLANAEMTAANATIYAWEMARSLADEYANHEAALSPALRSAIDEGGRIDPASYREALATADAGRRRFADAMRGCDVLLTPSTTGEAPAGLESTGSPVMNRLWTLLHVPAVSLPVAQSPAGLPVGLQVIGRAGDDVATLAAAAWIHTQLESRQ